MAIRRLAKIVDRDGVTGRLHHVDADDAENPMARVRLSQGAHVTVPFVELEHDADGGYRLRGRWSDYAIYDETGGASIPVVHERVNVSVRPAPEQTLRVRRRVVSDPQLVETPVWHERIEVDRIPIDQFVDVMPQARQDGDVLIIPCVEEVPVVVTRLRVREELRVRVVRERRIHRETVELRRHELEIDSAAPPPLPNHPKTPRGDSS